MLAFLLSPLGREISLVVIIALLIAGIFGYYEYSRAEIVKLNATVATVQQQAKDLTVAMTALDKSVQAIKAAQDTANTTITKAQDTANKAAVVINNSKTVIRQQAKTDPRALEKQINADHAALLKSLMEISQ